MSWFMDPVPDGDTVHQVATALRGTQEPYATQVQQVQTAHEQTQTAWGGPGSDAHTMVVSKTQQVAQEHPAWLIALADVFQILGTLLKLIFVLQMAWLAIQAATAVWAIVTAGLDALATEGPAAALAVAIQGMKDAAVSILQAIARSLTSRMAQAGAILGGASGVAVGVATVQQDGLSGWDAVLTVVGDGFLGAGAGVVAASNPWALAGTAIGVGQVVTSDAVGQTVGLQDAFQNITVDTMVVGSLGAPDAGPAIRQFEGGPGIGVTGAEADAANAQINILDDFRTDPANARAGGQFVGDPQSAAATGTGSDQVFLSGYPPVEGPVRAMPPNATRAGLGTCAEYKYVTYVASHVDQLPPGDVTVYEVQFAGKDPCVSCRNAFQWLADTTGRNVTVYWRDSGGGIFKWIFHPTAP